ncbi:MAG TPA: type III secretion system export apparatus subunit SctT [Xanthobacteraceae bacterium]|nr:type III secretion system export apparatus subunit SctT [Xanthobacteraceae bacterium]
MDSTVFLSPLAPLQPYKIAAALVLVRMMAMMLVMPAFTRLGATGVVRAGIALVLALPMIPLVAQFVPSIDLTPGAVAILMIKEAAVGGIIGLVLGVPLWAAEAAGDILDLQRGASMATLTNPSNGDETSVTGTLLAFTMLALFFVSGGVAVTLRVIYDSYALWPATATLPQLGSTTGSVLLRLLDEIVALGLMLAVPLVACLFVADVVIALLSKAAPNLNVFDLSFALKNLLFAVLIALYCAFLVSYMKSDLALFDGMSRRLESIARPSTP